VYRFRGSRKHGGRTRARRVPVPPQEPRDASERSWPKLCDEAGGPLHDEGAGMRCFLHSSHQFEHLYIPPR
jgi:hypothetical protein